MSDRPIRVLLMVLLILLVAGGCLPVAEAEGPNQVGLVIQKGDGSYVARCIEFSEPQITGYEVLVRSGLTLELSIGGMGALVCGIDGEGCPATDCMCDYPPNYWSYWHLLNGQWVYSQMGVGGYMVSPGSVEGWRWGTGNPPLVIPLEQICVPPATDTPPPTATWTPSPTPTSPPTETCTPTATATEVPTHAPTDTPIPTEESPIASDTPLPMATTETVAAATDTPPPTVTRAATHTPSPPPTTTLTQTPTAGPPTATATARPTLTIAAATGTGVVLPTPTLSFAPATATPRTGATQVAIAGPAADRFEQGREGSGQQAETLLAWLGNESARPYFYFVGFMMLIGVMFVFIKLRQR